MNSFEARLIEKSIYNTYGDSVSIRGKRKILHKFGRSETISDTESTVWSSPAAHETYITDNTIDSIVCTQADFTGGVWVEGHTISDSELSFAPGYNSKTNSVVRGITALTGQTAVNIKDYSSGSGVNTGLARTNRAKVYGTTALDAGEKIYFFDSSANSGFTGGKPNTDASIHLTIVGGRYQQTQKAATSISNADYWIIETWGGSISGSKTAQIELFLQYRQIGQSVFATIDNRFLGNTQPTQPQRPGVKIIPKNSDVRVIAIETTSTPVTDLEVTADIFGWLAIVTE